MVTTADKVAGVPRRPPPRPAVAPRERLGHRQCSLPRRARVRSVGDDEQRVRRHARPARLSRASATRRSPTRRRSSVRTDLPVSADLENCFADDPAGAADTITKAVGDRPRRMLDRRLHRRQRQARSTTSTSPPSASLPPPRPRTAATTSCSRLRAENHLHGIERPRRHDHSPAALLSGGGRCAVRAGAQLDRRHPQRRDVPRQAGERADRSRDFPPIAELASAGVAACRSAVRSRSSPLVPLRRRDASCSTRARTVGSKWRGDAAEVVASSFEKLTDDDSASRVRAYVRGGGDGRARGVAVHVGARTTTASRCRTTRCSRSPGSGSKRCRRSSSRCRRARSNVCRRS